MKNVTLKIPVKHLTTVGGRKTGKMSVQIDHQEFYAFNSAELSEKVWSGINAAMRRPVVAIARVGGYMSLLVFHLDGIETYRVDDIYAHQGQVPLRSTSWSGGDDIRDAIDAELLHLSMHHWSDGNTFWEPDFLSDDRLSDFRRWKVWQQKYARLRTEGHSESDAHRMAGLPD